MATYYVDNALPGSDSNDGTSLSSPWLTIAKVNGTSFSAGDTVLFKRGCTWREQLTVPTSGTSGSPITYRAYGLGNDPVISGADLDDRVTGWSGPDGNGEYSKTYATAPTVVIGDGVMLTAGTLGSLAATEWTTSGGKLYLGQAPTAYTVLEVAQRDFCITAADKDYIVIDGIQCEANNNAGGAINIQTGCSYITVQNCTASKVYEYGIRVAGSTYCTIHANTVEYVRKSSDGFGIALRAGTGAERVSQTTVSGNTVTTGLSAHGIYGSAMDNCTIAGNTAARIRLEPGAGQTIDTITITGNYVTGRIGVGRDSDGTKTVQNISITDNTVIGTIAHDYPSIETGYVAGTNVLSGNVVYEPHDDHVAVMLYDYGVGGTWSVHDNTIVTQNRGLANNGGGTLTVYDNTIIAMGTVSSSADSGIAVTNTAGTTLTVYGNLISGFYYGIVLNHAATVANIYNNEIRFVSIGLYIYGVALTATVAGNVWYTEAGLWYVFQVAGSTLTCTGNTYATLTGNMWRASGVTKNWAGWQAIPQDADGTNPNTAIVTVEDDELTNRAPFDESEAIGTASASGGTSPYAWEIVSQVQIA